MIVPLMLIVLMAIIEFALAFNAILGINRASTDAALVASSAGNAAQADCFILQQIEDDVTVPNDKAKIVYVEIQRTSPSGTTVYATTQYTRTNSTTCALTSTTSMVVPYELASNGYPPAQRCNVVAGCSTLTPARTTVDTVAVKIRYTYTYVTPLGTLLTLVDKNDTTPQTWTFNKRNLSRLEPVL